MGAIIDEEERAFAREAVQAAVAVREKKPEEAAGRRLVLGEAADPKCDRRAGRAVTTTRRSAWTSIPRPRRSSRHT